MLSRRYWATSTLTATSPRENKNSITTNQGTDDHRWRVESRTQSSHSISGRTHFVPSDVKSLHDPYRLGDLGCDISNDEKLANVRRSDTVTGTASNHNMDGQCAPSPYPTDSIALCQ
jgi:hypothetical protein